MIRYCFPVDLGARFTIWISRVYRLTIMIGSPGKHIRHNLLCRAQIAFCFQTAVTTIILEENKKKILTAVELNNCVVLIAHARSRLSLTQTPIPVNWWTSKTWLPEERDNIHLTSWEPQCQGLGSLTTQRSLIILHGSLTPQTTKKTLVKHVVFCLC